MSLVFLAVSRTGDDPARHDLFEVAAIHRGTDAGASAERVHHWAIKPDRLAGADADELVRTGFYDRSAAWGHNNAPVVAIDPTLGTTTPSSHGGVARSLARMLLGAQLMTFGLDREAEFLAEFLRSRHEPAGWVGHLDVTSAAAGAVAGYSHGWLARGRHDGMRSAALAVDVEAASMPLDPFRLALAMGVQTTGSPVSALVRAYLARDMWALISAPPAIREPDPPAGAHTPARPVGLGGVQRSPATYPNPYEAPAVGDALDGPSTGDVSLDRVIRGLDSPEH